MKAEGFISKSIDFKMNELKEKQSKEVNGMELSYNKSSRDEGLHYESDYCVWRGVTCDNVTFNVVALNLSGLNLEGEISPAIGRLNSLVSIDLKDNRLSGQIPDEIGDCSSLESLDLSLNEIHGDIPFSFSKMKQLENLSFRELCD
ncbi:hypothetical protein RIF29_14367 [Crotalaria pallida]|uniref:Uncharacterized protein n=1 Tax=Crotalaria pallida TaxID=3830 RepID=A0AAN9FJY6_CROPI